MFKPWQRFKGSTLCLKMGEKNNITYSFVKDTKCASLTTWARSRCQNSPDITTGIYRLQIIVSHWTIKSDNVAGVRGSYLFRVSDRASFHSFKSLVEGLPPFLLCFRLYKHSRESRAGISNKSISFLFSFQLFF